MNRQQTASSCREGPVRRILGTADVVVFDISWSLMGAFSVVYVD